jgi:ribosome-binding factor A
VSRRTEQMAATIRQALQQVIDRGLNDPRISGLITITAVRITDDVKSAFVDVSVMPADRQSLTMHGLRAAARHIRHQVGDLVAIRQMPELVFRLDESLKKQAAVLDAIAKAAAEREAKEAAAAARGDSPEADQPPAEAPPQAGTEA